MAVIPLRVRLPDGSVRQVPPGTTPGDIAASISPGLYQKSLAALVDGEIRDMKRPLTQDCALVLLTAKDPQALEVLRHSTAHLLAQAIKELHPSAQITIGPVIEQGFYYDIDCEKSLTEDDLPVLEKKMAEIAARQLEIERKEWPREKAVQFFEKQGEKYKAEIIRGLPDAVVSVYEQGGFTDLCRGPHLPNTKHIAHFRLTSVAGAYWRGDEKNKMLQRIYGTAFFQKKDLEEHWEKLELAKKLDHRRLGPELGLFTFLPVAPAMPFFLPLGARVYNTLVDFIRSQTAPSGYQEVICPQLMSSDLWKTSGHLEHYSENMYFGLAGGDKAEGQSVLKPMNCPGHAALFRAGHYSYRDLPLRLAEYSKLHRYERAGVTHGLSRTRVFAQDDAHIFCPPDQITKESVTIIHDTLRIYRFFGFENITLRLATRPQTALGTQEVWDRAIQDLQHALEEAGLPFSWAPGEGAFYGPKIEFHIQDRMGRQWQCGTIQVDFNLPDRFELEFIDTDGQARRPAMIHRAILGSFERFLGILLEHHAGHLPGWLAPVQIIVLTVTNDQDEYAKKLAHTLSSWGYRAESDCSSEKLSYKIRAAQMKKIPLMAVVGEKEKTEGKVSLRTTRGENHAGLSLDQLQSFLEPFQKPKQPETGGVSH